MKKHRLLIAFVAFVASALDATAADSISAYAMEMNTKRINGSLFRYTRFNTESPFPCLRLELIKPEDSWNITEKNDICEMNGMSLASDYAYSGFENIRFTDSALEFEFKYYLENTAGEYAQNCSVNVSKGTMQSIECTKPTLVD